MRQFLNKRVKLSLNVNGAKLYYTALIIDATDTHFTFIDKYNNKYCFAIALVEEAQLIN